MQPVATADLRYRILTICSVWTWVHGSTFTPLTDAVAHHDASYAPHIFCETIFVWLLTPTQQRMMEFLPQASSREGRHGSVGIVGGVLPGGVQDVAEEYRADGA